MPIEYIEEKNLSLIELRKRAEKDEKPIEVEDIVSSSIKV